MGGAFVNCCCVTPPANVEMKVFYLSVIWPGVTKYSGVGTYATGWQTTRYLTETRVETDQYGNTQTSVHDYDPDNGVTHDTVTTDPGFEGWSGSSTGSSYSDTTYTESRTGGSRVNTLSNPFTLADCIDTWRTRFDAFFALSAMDSPNSLTVNSGLSGLGGSPTSDVTVSLKYPTEGDYSKIWIKPSTGWSGGSVATNEYPWGGHYYIENVTTAGLIGSLEYDRFKPLGSSPLLGELDYGEIAYSSGWKHTATASLLTFTKSAIRLHSGMNCDLTGYTGGYYGGTNYELGDVGLIDFDISTGNITQRAGNLELAPGEYAFDGQTMHIFSGSKINPGSSVDGIDTAPSGYYGTVDTRESGTANTSGFPMRVTDYCPP